MTSDNNADNNDKEKPQLTFHADSSWLGRVMRAVSYSHEKSLGDSEGTSFLSCVLFSVGDKTQLFSESATSSVAINIGADEPVETEGSGEFLVPVTHLNQYIASMPSGDIAISFYPDSGVYTVTDFSGQVMFRSGLVTIISEDMIPRSADSFPESAELVTVMGEELIDAYKSSSTMALSVEKDPLAGQDPMAGCYLTVNNEGVQLFSLSSSAAESMVNAPGERESKTIITAPNTTLPRLGVFMGASEVSLAITDNVLHVSDGVIHMVITPLNIGERKSTISVEKLLMVMNPAWAAGVVDVSVSASEFFASLGRADSVGDNVVELEIGNTSMKMLAVIDSGPVPFKQSISCSTQWLDDSEHWVSIKFHIDTVKSLAATVGKRDRLSFRVSLKADGSPWAMTIITDDHDNDHPHNYQMISLKK